MSLHVATVRGIPIRLHVTMLVVVLLLVLQLGAVGVPAGVLLFGSVLLHELGHAVVAQRFGIPIASIDLHLLGGMALMRGQPRTPRQEILIAAAGPAVSLALAAGLSALAALAGGTPRLVPQGPADLLAYAGILNLGLGLFNLLPALPMDGGRIFRAALGAKLGDLRATTVAATVSRVFGGLFIAGALFTGSFSLGLIGLFLFFLVSREEQMARMRAQVEGERAPPASAPYVPFGPWSHRYGAGADPGRAPEVIVDADPREEPEVIVDPWGRRWVRRRARR
jgi:Zn-dependent protease